MELESLGRFEGSSFCLQLLPFPMMVRVRVSVMAVVAVVMVVVVAMVVVMVMMVKGACVRKFGFCLHP